MLSRNKIIHYYSYYLLISMFKLLSTVYYNTLVNGLFRKNKKKIFFHLYLI